MRWERNKNLSPPQSSRNKPNIWFSLLLAEDWYKIAILIETAILPDFLIAHEMDGNSLRKTLGLVFQRANGNLWISMITSIAMNATQISGGESLENNSIIMGWFTWLIEATDDLQRSSNRKFNHTPLRDYKTILNPIAPPANTTQAQVAESNGAARVRFAGSGFPVEFFIELCLGWSLWWRLAMWFTGAKNRRLTLSFYFGKLIGNKLIKVSKPLHY